jgi:hypothetical protein
MASAPRVDFPGVALSYATERWHELFETLPLPFPGVAHRNDLGGIEVPRFECFYHLSPAEEVQLWGYIVRVVDLRFRLYGIVTAPVICWLFPGLLALPRHIQDWLTIQELDSDETDSFWWIATSLNRLILRRYERERLHFLRLRLERITLRVNRRLAHVLDAVNDRELALLDPIAFQPLPVNRSFFSGPWDIRRS